MIKKISKYIPSSDDAEIKVIKEKLLQLKAKQEWVETITQTTQYVTCMEWSLTHWSDSNYPEGDGIEYHCEYQDPRNPSSGLTITRWDLKYPPEYYALVERLSTLKPGVWIVEDVYSPDLGDYAVLPKTDNTCQVYDNPLTITEKIREYIPSPDDAEIAEIRNRLYQLESDRKSVCTTSLNKTYSSCRNWYDANSGEIYIGFICREVAGGIELTYCRWVYPAEYDALSKRLAGLTPGVWIYRDVGSPNLSYDPYWLAVNRRIFFLGGNEKPVLKWEFTDRNFVGLNKDNLIEAVYTINNFISSVAYYKFCTKLDPICNGREGWYADVTYSCDAQSEPEPSDGNGYGSGSDSGYGGNGGDDGDNKCIGRCGKCEVSMGSGKNNCCCLDTKLLRYIFESNFVKSV